VEEGREKGKERKGRKGGKRREKMGIEDERGKRGKGEKKE